MMQEKFKVNAIVEVLLLVLTLLPMLTGNFLPQVNATLTADSWVTEITGLPFTPDLVETDLDGNIYCRDNGNDLYKSMDQGATWTKVLDGAGAGLFVYLLHCDSRGYIYSQHLDSDHFDVYRSTDDGESFHQVVEHVGRWWHMSEDSKGNLFVAQYTGNVYLWNSTDSGATWNVMLDLNDCQPEIDHFHCTGVDPTNDYVYAATGDIDDRIMVYNGTSWSNLTTSEESGNVAQPTDIWSDGSYMYFAPDGQTELWRIPCGGTWSQRELVLNLRWAPQLAGNQAMEGVQIEGEDIMLMGTEEGQLWGSWDGERWVKLYYTGARTDSIFKISNRAPIYFTERRNGRLYRLNIQKEDLIHLYYEEYLSQRGGLTNAETYVVEQPIWNGTNYVDLTNVALTDVQASIIGLNRSNWQTNAGFETGDKTGWNEETAPLGVIRSDSPANGTYYYAKNHTTSHGYLRTRSNIFVDASEADVTLFSYYVKANASLEDAFYVIFSTADGVRYYYQFDVTTSWVKQTHHYVFSDTDLYGKWLILFTQNKPLETCFDSFMYIYVERGIHRGVLGEDSIAYIDKGSTRPFNENNQTTTNPTLNINNQTVSHSGSLANGTESSATSLTGILTGAVEVSANIQGSGQAILKLNGTRVLYEDSIILKGRKDYVYYGRCYGTFCPTINTGDLVAVTNLASNITSLSYASNRLALIIDSPTGTTSTTKVCCGMRGEPIAIYTTNGTQTWSYNTSTTILTMNNNHTSLTCMSVYWKFPGDIDNDGDVDVYDLYTLAVAYGCHVEEPNYNSDSDIDGNNHINSDDLYILAEDYGELKP